MAISFRMPKPKPIKATPPKPRAPAARPSQAVTTGRGMKTQMAFTAGLAGVSALTQFGMASLASNTMATIAEDVIASPMALGVLGAVALAFLLR